MQNKIFLYGAGGHAACLIDIVEKEGRYRLVGLIDEQEHHDSALMGYPIKNAHDGLKYYRSLGALTCLVAIGDNSIRAQKCLQLTRAGFQLTSVVHPFCSIGRTTQIGKGCCVFHGAVIDPRVRLGQGIIVNKQALVGHDSRIDDYVHLAPGSKIGAGCHIGPGSLIGIGATIIPRTRIGANSIIGAGCVVLNEVPAQTTVVGVPARPLPTRAS